MAPGELAAGDGADNAMHVANRQFGADGFAALEGRFAEVQQVCHIQGFFQSVILILLAETPHFRTHVRAMQDGREVQTFGFPMPDGLPGDELVRSAHHFLQLAEAEPGHDLAELHGDEAHEMDDVLGVAGEPASQFGILGGHAHGAGVEMADAHHDAAQSHERSGCKTKLLRAQQRGHGHVAPGLQLAVGLEIDAAAQVVQHEGLVRFGQAQLPRPPGVLDGREGRRARAAVMAGNQNDIRVRLGHSGGDGADADFGDELDAHAGFAVGVLEVVDQFGQVLDGINIMVRRGGNQADPGRGAARFGDGGVNFFTRQFAALAGLSALRQLDLKFLGVDEVMAGHAEASAGNLFDGGILRVAVRLEKIAQGVFATFAGVAAAADPVHRHGQRLMRFLGDGAVAHGAGLEALHEAFHALHLLEGDGGFRRLEVQQTAQRAQRLAPVVEQIGVLAVHLLIVRPASHLQLMNRLGIE